MRLKGRAVHISENEITVIIFLALQVNLYLS